MQERLLRPRQVQELLSVSKATLWRMVRNGKLPAPKKLTDRCSVWRESEIQEAVNTILGAS